ncbi:hypothetical protein AAMO2058_000904900 [Amorphochlora amoebiformis]|mmetsp:Transcript_18875/g.30023  ORF Transcript_18875/g.30023 Transcript_18875/m.30023 type:complete len:591 (-) Transcript_18875:105-1877(-)
MMDAKKRSRMEEKANGSEGVNARKKGKPSSSITTAPWLSRNSKGFMCPYLDTINRKVLDFDFEKICSVSLNNFNVYACLVCGTYFQGRGKGTHAYLHSLEVDHHMFINLTTRNIYCLPDNYQVHEISLEDITYNLRPEFKKSDVRRFDKEGEYYHALDGTDYLIGFMGLNNIKNTDWFNVSAQALSHVPLLRNFFLFPENYESKVDDVEKKNPLAKPMLVKKFGEFMRKVWNPRGFKGHVSPHEILHSISTASRKKFSIGKQMDPIEFLAWFLNTCHLSMGGNKKRNSSIITQAFQGQVKMMTDTVVKKETRKIGPGQIEIKEQIESKITNKKFIYLSLELPTSPLFKDNQDTDFIPQVPLFDLLKKFDGVTTETLKSGEKRRFQLARLPKYLIIHYKRFTSNNWFKEKNPTLVNFPLYNLDMAPYVVMPQRPTSDDLKQKGIKELHQIMEKNKIDKRGCLSRGDLIEKINSHFDQLEKKRATRYDLLANVCHSGTAKDGTYKAHVLHKGMRTWFEAEDLEIKTSETMAQQVALSECYIQIYELQPPGSNMNLDSTVKVEPKSEADLKADAKSSSSGEVKVKTEKMEEDS